MSNAGETTKNEKQQRDVTNQPDTNRSSDQASDNAQSQPDKGEGIDTTTGTESEQ